MEDLFSEGQDLLFEEHLSLQNGGIFAWNKIPLLRRDKERKKEGEGEGEEEEEEDKQEHGNLKFRSNNTRDKTIKCE